MKVFIKLVILALFCFSTSSYSQNGINYKALIKDGSGNAVINTSITVQFQILKGVGMTNIYQETHNPTTDT
ncbi:MAG: hypothetical protein HKO61_14010, partial [Flavobacteriaceae bacterium]|nr:hypothetical protein [Flavobacteriaceae bacterium]